MYVYTRERKKTYHSLLGKSTDLLDGAGSTLLEANTVGLYQREKKKRN